MSNIIYQPLLNPLKGVLIDPVDIPQYVSRFMDDYLFVNTIKAFEQETKFINRWLPDDSIRCQFISNFQPLTFKLYKCDGTLVASIPLTTKQQDFFRPGYFIRQCDIDLATYDPGFYYFTMPEAGLIFEPFEIMAEEDESNPTLYIEYSNSERYGDVIFDSPFEPTLRVPAILKYKNPSSKDTIYSDQDEAETILHSIPFRIWSFILGGIGGIPPYLIDKVSRIFGCDSLKIDGREFTKNEGANWEPIELDGYPMAGWSIELREKLNRDSLIYEDSGQVVAGNAMILISDSKGFGLVDEDNDFLEILDIE